LLWSVHAARRRGDRGDGAPAPAPVGGHPLRQQVSEYKQPIDELKELVSAEEIQDVAALRNPKTALRRILRDRDDGPKTPASEPETRTKL
jgi:hypothetical protein